MTRHHFPAPVLAVLLAGTACDMRREAPASRSAESLGPAGLAGPAETKAADRRASTFVPASLDAADAGAAQASASAPDPLAARKLIRTGQLTIEVADYGEAAERVGAIARARGGYLAGTQSARGEHDRRQGTLTIRVPAELFEDAVAALKPLGKLLGEGVSVEDVTRAYADLETRLRVKRDTAARLRDILRTRTAKLSDVLEAEKELARVTEEIERMEGERRFYDHQVALSTIAVTLREPAPVLQAGMLQPMSEALRDSLRVLVASAAALLYVMVALLPWLAVLAAAAAGVRAVQRRRAAR